MSNTIRTFDRDGFTITIHHEEDNDPDLSYLGSYWRKSGTPSFPYYDRATKAIIHNAEEEETAHAEDIYWRGREYRYIESSGNYKGISQDEADTYTLQDVARLEDYGNGWACVGVVAVASLAGVALGRSSVWGIETDSDKAYFAEVEEQEAGEAIAKARAKLEELSKAKGQREKATARPGCLL